jgi:hypothetical protein
MRPRVVFTLGRIFGAVQSGIPANRDITKITDHFKVNLQKIPEKLDHSNFNAICNTRPNPEGTVMLSTPTGQAADNSTGGLRSEVITSQNPLRFNSPAPPSAPWCFSLSQEKKSKKRYLRQKKKM